MNKKVILKYVKKYNKDIKSGVLIIAGIILFARIVLPFINEIIEFQSQVGLQIEKNEQIQLSFEVLRDMNATDLDSYYETVLATLPVGKSVASIFQVLNSSANEANVELSSLNIEVGSVYSQKEINTGKSVSGLPFVNLIVRVVGTDSLDLVRFADILYESVPISEIKSISVSDTNGSFDMNFYFMPINEKGFAKQSQIKALSPAEIKLLTTFSEWQ